MLASIDQRGPGARRRAAGIVLALGIEAALFLAILTLGGTPEQQRPRDQSLITVEFAPEPKPDEPEPKPEQTAKPRALPPVTRPPPPTTRPRELTPPIPLPPAAVLPVARAPAPPPTPSTRIRAVVRDDMAGPVGPPDTGSRGDSDVVDHTASGEPIYAARWYREPTEQEMRGYLSTADPGWALITCKTEPQYRVDQCVLVDEWPNGSGMGRAALASTWQFQVRPPQKGGRALVGEWVRIRISYRIDRK
jgi:protein TonB